MHTVPDLTTENPRSPQEQWAGLVWLPRMADKARAARINRLGEFMYPCPMDAVMLEALQLSPERFSELAESFSDASFEEWLTRHLADKSTAELETANRTLLSKQPDTPEKWERFYKVRNELAPTRKDITTWAALIDLEEGRT